MVLLKAATTRLRFLNAMHTVTRISTDSETVFYIFFLTKNTITNKQPSDDDCLPDHFFILTLYPNY